MRFRRFVFRLPFWAQGIFRITVAILRDKDTGKRTLLVLGQQPIFTLVAAAAQTPTPCP